MTRTRRRIVLIGVVGALLSIGIITLAVSSILRQQQIDRIEKKPSKEGPPGPAGPAGQPGEAPVVVVKPGSDVPVTVLRMAPTTTTRPPTTTTTKPGTPPPPPTTTTTSPPNPLCTPIVCVVTPLSAGRVRHT